MFCLTREDLSPTLRVENSLEQAAGMLRCLPRKTLSVIVEELATVALDGGLVGDLFNVGRGLDGVEDGDPERGDSFVPAKGLDADVAHVGGDHACQSVRA
jgi:hypothetical protein